MTELDDDIARGCLPSGEPIEARWGSGWWSVHPEQYPEPDYLQCPICGAWAIDYGDDGDDIECSWCDKYDLIVE